MRNALFYGFAFSVELRLEVDHLKDGAFVQQFLEPGHEARQVVDIEFVQPDAVFGAGGQLLGVEFEGLFEFGHRAHDLFA